MTTTVRILGSRAREQVPGTSITLHAPGFRGSLTRFAPGVASSAAYDLPFAESAAGADVMLAAQLKLQLEARQDLPRGLRSRSALVIHPRVIVPRRHGVTYALLQTDETGTSSFLAPQPGEDTEAVFLLRVADNGFTRRILRVLMWPDLQTTGPGSLAVAARWERLRRPHHLAQRNLAGRWQPPDWDALREGPVLMLLHDTFSTSQATFSDWMDDETFEPLARRYQGRCLAFTHPTLSVGIDENLQWLGPQLASLPGPFDVVAHGRGGLLARQLAVDGRLPLRRFCQVGAPNNGTPLAREANLPQFLDGHVAMLTKTPKCVALGTLEGALCLARCVAQGRRVSLPGIEELTPESASLRGPAEWRAAGLELFTVGAQCALPGHHAESMAAGEFAAAPNDGVVPASGCHEPGMPIRDSLQVADMHHHGYFADARVRANVAAWLS